VGLYVQIPSQFVNHPTYIYTEVVGHSTSDALQDARRSVADTLRPVHGMQPYRTEDAVHFYKLLTSSSKFSYAIVKYIAPHLYILHNQLLLNRAAVLTFN